MDSLTRSIYNYYLFVSTCYSVICDMATQEVSAILHICALRACGESHVLIITLTVCGTCTYLIFVHYFVVHVSYMCIDIMYS